MPTLTIPLPEPGVLSQDDKHLGSAWVLWLTAIYEALRPLADITLRAGGTTHVFVRCSNNQDEMEVRKVSPRQPFLWGEENAYSSLIDTHDSTTDGFWLFIITIDREGGMNRQEDVFNFYFADFENGGVVAAAKFSVILALIQKRTQPPLFPPERILRALDILTES